MTLSYSNELSVSKYVNKSVTQKTQVEIVEKFFKWLEGISHKNVR